MPRLRGILDPSAASRRQGAAHVPMLGLRPPRSAENGSGDRLVKGRATATKVRPHQLAAFVSHASNTSTISDISQSRLVTLAAIAGVTRSVLMNANEVIIHRQQRNRVARAFQRFVWHQVGFLSGRSISSYVGTWVLSSHDSSAAPQTVQTASPVCGTKNFSSVRLYSAPQLH